MIICCSKCSTEFDLDPTQVGAEGVTLRCSVCSHMFHAEPNPLAGNREPWQLCNPDNHLFSLPDLRSIVDWIEDGRLRPDDQVSRTGRHWIRLGDIAELSTLFVGFDGLPRVFKAREVAPAAPSLGALGPMPAFGEDLEEIPPFGVGNAPLEPSGPSASQSGPMSMLEAVTKAVSTPPPRRDDDAVVQPRRGSRSEPILVADIAASQSAAPRLPSTLSLVAEPSAAETTGPDHPPPSESSATDEPAEAVAVAESLHSLHGEAPAPRRSLGWVAILGVAAGLIVMLGVPNIRARIFGGEAAAGSEIPRTQLAAIVDEDPVDLQQADQALFELGLAETTRAQATLQKIIDERVRRKEAVDDIRLAQAELILSRALAFKIALAIEPTAVNGTARARAQEDETWAADLVREIPGDKIKDKLRYQRVLALVALVQGRNAEASAAAASVAEGAEELRLLIASAPLWESLENPVPSGVISGIQALPRPSTLSRSVLGLALWRGGDSLGAMKVVMAVQAEVADQPLAMTLHKALTQALAEEQDVVEVTPPDPGNEVAPPPSEIKRPTPPSTSGGGSSSDFGPAETRTQRGCDKVRGGDATAGIKLLLAAIDANQVGLDTYLCLGDGYSKLGNHGSSLAFYERALAQAPKRREALEGAAQAAERLKRTSRATDLYKRLLAVDPNNEAAKSFLGSGAGSTPTPTPSTGGDPGTTKPTEDGGLLPVKGGETKPFSEGV